MPSAGRRTRSLRGSVLHGGLRVVEWRPTAVPKSQVDVNAGAMVRTRSGYWAPRADEVVKVPPPNAPDSVALAGLFGPHGLPLRAVVTPVGLADGGSGTARHLDVGVVLNVKWPARAVPKATRDTVTVVRNVYDATGSPGPPVREVIEVELQPGRAGKTFGATSSSVSLPPGRYQIRFNTQAPSPGQRLCLRRTGCGCPSGVLSVPGCVGPPQSGGASGPSLGGSSR
jgi:hypothetical protein